MAIWCLGRVKPGREEKLGKNILLNTTNTARPHTTTLNELSNGVQQSN